MLFDRCRFYGFIAAALYGASAAPVSPARAVDECGAPFASAEAAYQSEVICGDADDASLGGGIEYSADNLLIRMRGSVGDVGGITTGDGNDGVQLEDSVLMTLSGTSRFGGGVRDLFANSGNLTIAPSGGTSVRIEGLERFESTGVLIMRIADLPSGSGAVLDFGATGTVAHLGGTIRLTGTSPVPGLQSARHITLLRAQNVTRAEDLRIEVSPLFTLLGSSIEGGIVRVTVREDFTRAARLPVRGLALPSDSAGQFVSADLENIARHLQSLHRVAYDSPVLVALNDMADALFAAGSVDSLEMTRLAYIRLLPRSYDALLQAGWHADKRFAEDLWSESCALKKLDVRIAAFASQKGCVWMRAEGGMFEQPSGEYRSGFEEEALGFSLGMRAKLESWEVVLAALYHNLAMDGESASADGDRLFLGAGMRSKVFGLDWDASFRFGYSSYDMRRAVNLGAASLFPGSYLGVVSSDPDLIQLGAAIGVSARVRLDEADRAKGKTRSPSGFFAIPRLEIHFLHQILEGVLEKGNAAALAVDDIGETPIFFRASGVGRYGFSSKAGDFSFWAGTGLGFMTEDPRSEISARLASAPIGVSSFRISGAIARSFVDYEAGFRYKSVNGLSAGFSYQGSVAMEGRGRSHQGMFRFGYIF